MQFYMETGKILRGERGFGMSYLEQLKRETMRDKNWNKIQSVRKECVRFLEKIEDLSHRMEADGASCMITGNAESAAARRASMDLTRALAEFRKPWR